MNGSDKSNRTVVGSVLLRNYHYGVPAPFSSVST